MKKNRNIFIACDTTSVAKVRKIIKQTQTNKKIGYTIGIKVGLEFILSRNGRNFISKIKNKKFPIFVDAKLCDIDNTMKSAVIALKDLKINYLTVHISSGLSALKAVKKVSGKIKIVGVSTLTSFDNKKLKETFGYNKTVKSLVVHQAKLASKANLDAFVTSAHEVPYIKKIFKKEIITPGIRMLGDKTNDQKRIMTPKNAFKNGASSIVVGRSITAQGNIKNKLNKLINSLK